MIDKIYIICKKTHYNNKKLCIIQLESNNINNYIFKDAIYPSENDSLINSYKNIIKNMDRRFVMRNFSLGAFGCLLSHIECIKHAKNNSYNNILVLEEDFIICKDFHNKYNSLINNIRLNRLKWDLIYLGKKQGNDNNYKKHNNLYLIKKYDQINNLNDFFYIPNYETWASHSLLIKNTIFDSIIEFEKNIIAPYDILLMTLYDKFSFLCVKDDLFITREENSDIRTINTSFDPYKQWNWNINSYIHFNKYNIKNFIIYDFLDSIHTHRYIHKMYHNFLTFYYPNLNVIWCNNLDEIPKTIKFEETIFFISPCHKNITVSLPEQSFYIIHLDCLKNSIKNSKNNYENVSNTFFKNHKNIFEENKYIIITCRDGISNTNYFKTNIKEKIICLPWFSNNLYSELNNIKKNLTNFYTNNLKKEYFCYYGSIWRINIDMICELINVCVKNNYKLLLKGRIFGIKSDLYKYICDINSQHQNIIYEPYNNLKSPDDYENSFKYIDDKYGIKYMLPLQGNDHNDKYISNRIFETLSQGYIVVTNCDIVKKYFTNALHNNDILKLLNGYVNIMSNRKIWINTMNNQINEFLDKFYGYNNVNKIFDFMYKINEKYNRLICYDNYDNFDNKSFDICIKNKNNTLKNNDFKYITNDIELSKATFEFSNSILLYDENYDIFLLDKLLNIPVYNIFIDKDLIIDKSLQKILKDKKYELI